MAQLLIAIAENDDMRSPNETHVLRETFAKVNLALYERALAG